MSARNPEITEQSLRSFEDWFECQGEATSRDNPHLYRRRISDYCRNRIERLLTEQGRRTSATIRYHDVLQELSVTFPAREYLEKLASPAVAGLLEVILSDQPDYPNELGVSVRKTGESKCPDKPPSYELLVGFNKCENDSEGLSNVNIGIDYPGIYVYLCPFGEPKETFRRYYYLLADKKKLAGHTIAGLFVGDFAETITSRLGTAPLPVQPSRSDLIGAMGSFWQRRKIRLVTSTPSRG